MNYLDIYDKCFSFPEYNVHSLDLFTYQYAFDFINNNVSIKSIIDIGSGRGNFLRKLAQCDRNLKITSLDISKYHNYSKCDFIQCDLSNKLDLDKMSGEWDIAVCLDVLEHLEENIIEDVVEFISRVGRMACFSINCEKDTRYGMNLHLTIRYLEFWEKILKNNYFIIDLVKLKNEIFMTCKSKCFFTF